MAKGRDRDRSRAFNHEAVGAPEPGDGLPKFCFRDEHHVIGAVLPDVKPIFVDQPRETVRQCRSRCNRDNVTGGNTSGHRRCLDTLRAYDARVRCELA